MGAWELYCAGGMEPDRGDKRPLRMILRLPLVLIALGFIWSTLVSAKSAVMRLPDELVATERIAVEGRQGWRKLQHLRRSRGHVK